MAGESPLGMRRADRQRMARRAGAAPPAGASGRRWRLWPILGPIGIVVVLAGGWCGLWYYADSVADRTLAAAEALFHASDHLEHLKAPPGPPQPPAEDVSRHLAQVYFRTRQADYFLQEIHDSSASPLVSLARQYYQRAVQSYDRSDFRGADEYGKTAEELVKALEDLAQAATLAPQPRR